MQRLLVRKFSSFINANVSSLIPRLEAVVTASNVTCTEAQRDQFSHDESYHRCGRPDVVVTPQNADQVAAVVRLCDEARVPIIPFGTGTGLEGGVNALQGGVCLSLRELNHILEVSADDLDCTVEAAVTRNTLNNYLHDKGVWFPVDPGADASLGGMCATSASGTNAVRYGTMKELTVNLQVALPSGQLIHTRGAGRRSRKSAAGYNLTNLFVGSEGTLGVITAATLRLFPYPEKMASAVCSFGDIKSTVDTVVQILQCCVPVARVELVDDVMMDACNKYSHLDYPVSPALFLEFHGSEAQVSEQADLVGELCDGNGGASFQWSVLPEERQVLWKARHDAYYACMALRPNCAGYSTDVCVPISRLSQVLVETKQDIDNSGLVAPIVGHVGDGNFHCFFIFDADDAKEVAAVKQLSDKIVERALANEGTCTGEHGIGMGKLHYMKREFGEDTLNLMRQLKTTIDPNNIMNPGKVVPF